MSFVDLCRRFISIDSTKTHGGEEAILFAGELCRDAGLFVEYQEETLNGNSEKNLIARPSDSMPAQELLLQTHIDTADPGIHALWTKTQSNPFNASIHGDELYGLGSAHSKLDFLCKLEAIKLVSGPYKLPFVLLGTFGQQQGMTGAIKALRKGKINAQKALIGHPTDLKIIHASAGFATVEINIPFSEEEIEYHQKHDLMLSSSTQSKMFYGKSSYSAYSTFDDNAIVQLLEYIAELPDSIAIMDIEGGVSFNTVPESAVIELDIVGSFKQKTVRSKITEILSAVRLLEEDFENYPAEGFEPNTSRLNIGTVCKNRDHIRLTGSCHLTPSVSQSVYEQWMKSIKQSCEQVGATFRVVEYKPPFETSVESEFADICLQEAEAIGLSPHAEKSVFCTEANVFSRMKIESLVFGPGVFSENAFCANEHVLVSQLEKSIEYYEKVLKRICL